MIQRIQTLYLLIVTVLMAVTVFLPFLTLSADDLTSVDLSFRGFTVDGWNWTVATGCLSVMTALIALLSLGDIFLFTNRALQVRICIFNMLLMVGWYALLAVVVWFEMQNTSYTHLHLHIACCFPLVSIILTYLAMRGILKDDALVKSLDRLR